MNVSGHRISTAEVESALVGHSGVAEAAVIGAADETTGQGIVAFVILREGVENTGDELIAELRQQVSVEISPDRQAARDQRRAGAAQDAVGQDHAAPAQGRRRGPRARRHLDARRSCGLRGDPGEEGLILRDARSRRERTASMRHR